MTQTLQGVAWWLASATVDFHPSNVSLFPFHTTLVAVWPAKTQYVG